MRRAISKVFSIDKLPALARKWESIPLKAPILSPEMAAEWPEKLKRKAIELERADRMEKEADKYVIPDSTVPKATKTKSRQRRTTREHEDFKRKKKAELGLKNIYLREESDSETDTEVWDYAEYFKEGHELNPQPFDPRSVLDGGDVPIDFTMLVTGKRRTGKSFFIRWFAWHLKERYGMVKVFTKTNFTFNWSDITSPDHIHSEYSEDLMWRLLDHQAAVRIRYEADARENAEGGVFKDFCDRTGFHRILLLFDDCIAGKEGQKIKYGPAMEEIYANGRHYNVGIIFASQDVKGAYTPLMRVNTDLAVMFVQNQWRNRDSLHADFGGPFPRKQFEHCLDAFTDEHKALIFNNGSLSRDPDDLYYWAKAVKPPEYRITRILRAMGVDRKFTTKDIKKGGKFKPKDETKALVDEILKKTF